MRSSGLAVLLVSTSVTHASNIAGRVAKVTADLVLRRANATLMIEKRVVTEISTCGYLTGDPSKPRTANSGFDCREDTANSLWGFCPTTVISATDCGLAAACIDSFACSTGCGYTDNPSLTTFTCSASPAPFCSTALLTVGVDETYSYIACDPTAKTDHLLFSPNADVAATSGTAASASASETPTDSPSPTSTEASTLPSLSTAGDNSTPGLPSASSSISSAAAAGTRTQPSGAVPAAASSSSSSGPIIGGVIGGLVVVCGSAVLAIYLLKRDRSNKRKSAAATGTFAAGVLPPDDHSPKDPTTVRYGGWGPRELPASQPVEQVRGPVELPSYAM